MTSSVSTARSGYYPKAKAAPRYDEDLEPFAPLFQKPMSVQKSHFTRKELELMCKDPLHSPKLIMYLIEMLERM